MQDLKARPITCTSCKFENPPGVRFCGRCGAALPSLCPACGAENPPGFKFCGQCGASLEAPDAAASAGGAGPGISLEDLIEIVEEEQPAEGELPENMEKAANWQPEAQTGGAIEERAPAWLACTVCGTDNPATALYCEVCGAIVAPAGVPCSACGHLNGRGSLFCENCGERLGLAELL